MQLGFVIDHGKCIGCHACTVACKSENDVPLGDFRTWVKYTETGAFPAVKRSFAVLRCNQCTDAPCVEICPVTALDKRDDGIVDVDPARCIGCKSCMHACPYDALYINESTGTAEKCHFCAHRVEEGLAPACAVVCPTEAIIPGDFDDPQSAVSKLRSGGKLAARKTEAGTGPNVLYREVETAGIDPMQTTAAGGYLWSQRRPGTTVETDRFLETELERKAAARTVYNVDRKPLWGAFVSGYLFTKSLSAGLFLSAAAAGLTLLDPSASGAGGALVLAGLGVLFLLLTTGLLVGDLKRPARFLFVLTKANWSSWLARGAVLLSAYGALLTVFLALGLFRIDIGSTGRVVVTAATALAGAGTAMYTAWLFGQAKGRVLWMKRGLALQLLVQAFLAGAALHLIVAPWLGQSDAATDRVRWILLAAVVANVLLTLAEPWMSPPRRETEYAATVRLISHGPFARSHWLLGVCLGSLIPIGLLIAPFAVPWQIAGALALVGLFVEEDILVRAGQALPIS